METSIRPLGPNDAATIISWRYLPPYDFYKNQSDGQEAAEQLLRPDYNYHAMVDQTGKLIGFFCLGSDAQVPGWKYDGRDLDLGMGLAQSLLGQGMGGICLQAILEHLRTNGVNPDLRATVAAWNQRAIHLCLRAGFCEIDSFEGPSGCFFKVLALGAGKL